MKLLERQFFRCCIRRIDYNSVIVGYDTFIFGENRFSPNIELGIIKLREPIDDIIEEFSKKKNVSKKQLYYYLSKWNSRGLYYYRYHGFDLDVLYDLIYRSEDKHVKNKEYGDAVPKRVIRKLYNLFKIKVASEYLEVFNFKQ